MMCSLYVLRMFELWWAMLQTEQKMTAHGEVLSIFLSCSSNHCFVEGPSPPL